MCVQFIFHFFLNSAAITRSANEGGNNIAFEPQIAARDQSPGFDALNDEIEQARLQSIALDRSRSAIKDKLAKKEKKKDKKKKKKQLSTSDSESALNMSETDGVSEAAAAANGEAAGSDIPPEMLPAQNRLRQDSNELEEENERRKNREPAIVFKDLEVSDTLPFSIQIFHYIFLCHFQ